MEVDPKDLVAPTSRILSPQVIQKFELAAGDFQAAVCLDILRPWTAGLITYENVSSHIACYKLGSRSCGTLTTILRIMMRTMAEVRRVGRTLQDPELMLYFYQAIACEVLARRIVHRAPQDRLNSLMSTRYRHLESDGDKSDLSSALELAIDTNW